MCGIAGYINTDLRPIPGRGTMVEMLRLQKHRGPDDSGIRAFSLKSGTTIEMDPDNKSDQHTAYEGIIGFNRLSILDLSYNGHQPMVSPDGKVIIALNGEIYNAFDFKNELQNWGYTFKSQTDTEIVLALYLKYEFEGMLNRLNGMFAIVIIDLELGSVFLARDRFGIKPMYYLNTGKTFAFSSELKSFKCLSDFVWQLDESQVDEYMIFRSNLEGTLFKGIDSLKPGCYLTFTLESGITVRNYFNINTYNRDGSITCSIQHYKNSFEETFGKSVRSQLISDVKLGCQLSGGVDSTLVTMFANMHSDKGRLESVSIVFEDERFSEEEFINIVTEKIGIITHKFLLDSNYYLENFEKATWHLELPLNHPNTIGIFKLSQRAKDYVTVLLSGEGADEVFGGYNRFYDVIFPFRARKILAEIVANKQNIKGMIDYFKLGSRAIMANSYMHPLLAERLRSRFSIDAALMKRKSLYHSLTGSLFDRQVKYEMISYLPDLLIRQDKMSMAHSIENRVPFLDNEVVKQSFCIPETFLLNRKIREGCNNQKYLLKLIVADCFGRDFAFRNKMGFGIPLRDFFSDPKFSRYLKEIVLPGIKNRGLFNHRIVSEWISNTGRISHKEMEALWVIISFEIWASIFLNP
ncbi:MAG TPA: asparagine synthase (glutamine-hydrolyzing) [Bacteroidales bacterium]|nr:asparagine synthase (glutamine-hydrolyzing) [Bacteroidales bacterium]